MFENFMTYFFDFKRFAETGDVLTKKERILLEWCNYLSNNTKFENIVLNRFNDITFESNNRNFKLEVNDDYTYTLTYEHTSYRYATLYDGLVVGDFYKLRNWFKKRNYLK